MIQDHLQDVQTQLASAAVAADRQPESVRLIAVSKTKPMSAILEAHAAGQLDFGENRVQELVEKHPQLPEARWHMIGRLQRNKVKFIAPFIHLIHSVDSERLLAEIDKQAAKVGRIQNCLLQLNISEEEQKGGFEEAEAADVLRRIGEFPNVQINGLMGMAAFISDEAVIAQQFRRLQQAAKGFRSLEGERVSMQELSMGMSGDFALAIAAGSTMVRIGSAIFGRRG